MDKQMQLKQKAHSILDKWIGQEALTETTISILSGMMSVCERDYPTCNKLTNGHSSGKCSLRKGHDGNCWFPNMWNDM